MTSPTIEQAIDALRRLTPERQTDLAGYIMHLATTDDREPEDIASADLPFVLKGLAQIKRGEFATSEQVTAALRSFDE